MSASKQSLKYCLLLPQFKYIFSIFLNHLHIISHLHVCGSKLHMFFTFLSLRVFLTFRVIDASWSYKAHPSSSPFINSLCQAAGPFCDNHSAIVHAVSSTWPILPLIRSLSGKHLHLSERDSSASESRATPLLLLFTPPGYKLSTCDDLTLRRHLTISVDTFGHHNLRVYC